MATVAIALSDAGLSAVTDSGPVGAPSPGYALLDRGRMILGEPARAAGRLKPRHTNHRFWNRLDQEPVGRPFPRGITHADLVYAHVADYWGDLRSTLGLDLAETSVLLAIPGAYGTPQLGLLLGIVRACDMPVTGLVDAGVAALDGLEGSDHMLHLDIHLHRAVWTLVDRGGEPGEHLTRRRVETVDSVGLRPLQDAWARRLAETFVRHTRFDPLHGAATEQVLYDRLPAWIEATRHNGAAEIALEVKGGTRSIEISVDDLTAAAQPMLDSIVETAERLIENSGPSTLALSARATRIPGLGDQLASLADTDPLELPPGAAATGALRHRRLLEQPGRELPLVLGLPAGRADG